MAEVTICSDFGGQKNKVCHCFHYFPIYLPWGGGIDMMILVLWMLSFKPSFSLSSFTSPHTSEFSLLLSTFTSLLPPLPLHFSVDKIHLSWDVRWDFCSPFHFLSLSFSFLLLSSLTPSLLPSPSLCLLPSSSFPFPSLLSFVFLLFVFRELENIFAKDLCSPISGGGNGQETSLPFKEVNKGPARIRDSMWFRWIHFPFLFCFLE